MTQRFYTALGAGILLGKHQCGGAARPLDPALEAPGPESVESNYFGTILETRQPIS